ncbi:MAG: hypothetical protein HYZ52_05490 [Candidatus Omnitrophica bacterium]|nr:hypothetical protein [Candidatus Omnitrophota bacterium]
MHVGQSLKKGFSVTQDSMSLVLTLFVFGLFWNLVNVFFTSKFETPDAKVSAVVIAVAIVFVLLSIFVQAGSLGFIREKLKSGASSLSIFAASGTRYYGALFLIGLLVSLVIGVFVLLAALAVAAFGNRAEVLAMGLAILLGAIGIYFVILLFLAPYIAVADDQKAIASLKQSVGVVRKNILAVFGLALILVAIGFVVGLVLGAIFALVGAAMPKAISDVVFAILGSFVNSYLGVLVTASFMSFYLGTKSQA